MSYFSSRVSASLEMWSDHGPQIFGGVPNVSDDLHPNVGWLLMLMFLDVLFHLNIILNLMN